MTEKLFFKNLKVQFKSQDHVERRGIIRITIETQTTTSPMHRKDLIVRITDDSNPLFLYNLCLSEEDFQHLKNQQGLLVDFGSFPQNLVGLLQGCKEQEDKEEPQFVLEFWLNDGMSTQKETGTLKIIQINSFKNLQHLALRLALANDSDLKKYLASCLKVTREKLNKERNENESMHRALDKELGDTKQKLEEQSNELEKLRSHSTGEVGRLIQLHRQELNVEKEKHLTTQEEMQHRYEKEKNEIQIRLQSTIDQKDSDLDALKSWKFKTEANIREQETRLDALNRELDITSEKLQKVKDDNKYLNKQYNKIDMAFQEKRMECGKLEEKLTSQEKHLKYLSSSLGTLKNQKDESEHQRASMEKEKQSLQLKNKDMMQEAQKADEMMKRFKNQLKSYMMKLKTRNEVIVRLQKTLEDQSKTLEESQQQLKSADGTLKEKERELVKSKEELDIKTQKLNETAELIKSNEHLIKYLNRQINEVKMSNQPLTSNASHNSQPHHNGMYNYNRPSEKGSGRIQAYSTPLGSYIPGIQNSHNIGVSTITTTSPKPTYSQEHTVKEDSTGHLSKTDTLPSPLQYCSTKNKENDSPVPLPIRPEYLMKSTDEGVAESNKPARIHPSLQTYQRNSNDRRSMNVAAQNNIAVSAYFSGKLPKSQ